MGACCSTETPEGKAQRIEAVKKQVQDQLRTKSLRNNVLQQSADENPLDKYQVVKQLGVGSMGRVDLVRRRPRRPNKPDEPTTSTTTTSSATSKDSQTGDGGEERLYALKTLRVGRITKAYLRELHNEIRIVSDLDHPGIVKFYQVYYTSDKHIYIVMEVCSGGDLYKREPYTEKQACNVVLQILSAVAYMHSRGYVHRDIKFENIMFETEDSDKINIIDFGLSGRYNPDRPLQAQYGTIETMAPEVIAGDGYDAKCDVWSVGVVAFELICGEKPFQSGSVFILQDKIAAGDYNFSSPGWRYKNPLAKEFCQRLLQVKPSKRPSAAYAMRHGWFQTQQTAANHGDDNQDGEEFANSTSQRQRLMAYSTTPELQRIASLLVAHRSFSKEVKELRRLFEQMDTGKTGYISLEEFREGFQKYSGDEAEMNAIFQGMDILKDGQISYTEFMAAALTTRGNVTEDQAVEAFEQLDVDHSGKITVDNLRTVLGRDFEKDEAERIIDEMDITRDGMVSLEEFIVAFRKNADAVAQSTFVQGML